MENIKLDSPVVAAHRQLLRCAEKLSSLEDSKKTTTEQLLAAKCELNKAQHKLWELYDNEGV